MPAWPACPVSRALSPSALPSPRACSCPHLQRGAGQLCPRPPSGLAWQAHLSPLPGPPHAGVQTHSPSRSSSCASPNSSYTCIIILAGYHACPWLGCRASPQATRCGPRGFCRAPKHVSPDGACKRWPSSCLYVACELITNSTFVNVKF